MSRPSSSHLVTPAVVALVLLAPPAPSAGAQSSGRFHLVRSTSGSRGTPEGTRFVMEDPRTEFQAGKDRQVLVVFEWEGPIGPHRCEGSWKDPSGRVVFTSQADVHPRTSRFGVYWGLSLPDTVATGNWVLEARVDGEPAGVHAFQILKDAGAPSAPAARVLSLAELYKRGLAAAPTLEAVDAKGSLLARTSGFAVAPTMVLTSFSTINGAHAVRLTAGSGPPLVTSEVVSWSRRDDWAILRFAGAAFEVPARAAEPLHVGDRCFYIDAREEGGRVIAEVSVVGRSETGDVLLSAVGTEASVGGPVLNAYGDVVAVLVGSSAVSEGSWRIAAVSERPGKAFHATRARSMPQPPDAAAAVRTLDEMAGSGVFVRRLVHTPHFVSGVMGTGVTRQGPIPMAADQRFRFTRADRECVIFVTWTPARNDQGILVFEIYDEDNRRLGHSEPRKTKMRNGASFVQWWPIALGGFRPGEYRVDLVKDGDPVWRTFFRLAD